MPGRPDRRRRTVRIGRPRRTRSAPVEATERGSIPGFDRLQQIATVVAPTTVATALLAYTGYLATRARFEYFGVYLDLVDLSTTDLLLYGSEVVYVPIVLGALAMLAVLAVRYVWERIEADERHPNLAPRAALTGVLAGLLLLIRALLGIVAPGRYQTGFLLMTPISLVVGTLLLRSGAGTLGRRLASPVNPRLATAARLTTATLVVAGLFWIANGFAALYGTGRALDDVAELPHRPEVVLDSKEPLDLPPSIAETRLSGEFRYRYRGLRLLVEANGRLFLVPARWEEDVSRTVVLKYDDVRLQLDA